MALVYRRKLSHQTLQYARYVVFVSFIATSTVMVSYHMTSRTYVPQMRAAVSKDCDKMVVEQQRSVQANSKKSAKSNGTGVSKIPSLAELKSFRNTLDRVITIVQLGPEGKREQNVAKVKTPLPDSQISGDKEPPPLPDSFQKNPQEPKLDSSVTIKASEATFLLSIDPNKMPHYNATFVRDLFLQNRTRKRTDAVYMNVTRLKLPADIPLHPLSRKDPYKTRMVGFQDTCRKIDSGNLTTYIDLKRMIRDDGHRTLMCVVPKAACTTWKSIFYYLTGNSKIEEAFSVKRGRLDIDYGKIKSMARLSRQGIVARLNNFTKIMVTRHPFHRLVSAYRSKFERRLPTYVMTHGRRIAKNMIEDYLGGYVLNYTRRKKSDVLAEIAEVPTFRELPYSKQFKVLDITSRGYRGNITFEEFLRYGVVANAHKAPILDVHWRPQHYLCNPCAINYDFVVRFDDLENESNMVLSYMQRNDPKAVRIKFPGGNPASVTDNVTKKFFDKIPPDLKEAVRKVYEKDFQYFNYDPNSF